MRLVATILWICSIASAGAITKDELIRQITVRVGLLQQELDRAQNKAVEADEKTVALQGEYDQLETQFKQVATERDGWRAYGESEHGKSQDCAKSVVQGKLAILRRNIVISCLIIAFAAYAYVKFYLRIPI